MYINIIAVVQPL